MKAYQLLLACAVGLLVTEAAQAQVRFRSVQLKIKTGGDDLRGGRDNLNITVHYRGGGRRTFFNVNRSRNWKNNTWHTVYLRYGRRGLLWRRITHVTFRTTFRGGFDGDNWNMDRVHISVFHAALGSRRYIGRAGPFRFTGDRKSLRFPLPWNLRPPVPLPPLGDG